MTGVSQKAQACAAEVKAHALECGFDACGIAEAGCIDPRDRLGAWLDAGYHAGMEWIRRTKETRQDVRRLLPEARSVIVVAQGYFAPSADPPADAASIARYARGRDYHRVLMPPLRRLARFVESLDEHGACLLSIDTKPILEKAWAMRAGLGWIGKHSLLIHPELGSWLVLGLIVTTLPLAPDEPCQGQCGECQRCVEACPTAAIVAPGVLDARRCIAYHTIESVAPIPQWIAAAMGTRLFGCDACQEACPWNREPRATACEGLKPHPARAHVDLKAILDMDEQTFDETFRGTPVRRQGLAGLQRTAAAMLNRAPERLQS